MRQDQWKNPGSAIMLARTWVSWFNNDLFSLMLYGCLYWSGINSGCSIHLEIDTGLLIIIFALRQVQSAAPEAFVQI